MKRYTLLEQVLLRQLETMVVDTNWYTLVRNLYHNPNQEEWRHAVSVYATHSLIPPLEHDNLDQDFDFTTAAFSASFVDDRKGDRGESDDCYLCLGKLFLYREHRVCFESVYTSLNGLTKQVVVGLAEPRALERLTLIVKTAALKLISIRLSSEPKHLEES